MSISINMRKLITRFFDSGQDIIEIQEEPGSQTGQLCFIPVRSVYRVSTCGRPKLDRNHDNRFRIRARTSSQGAPTSSPASISSSLSSSICFCASVIGTLDGSTTRLSQSDSISSSRSSTFRLSILIAGRDIVVLYRASKREIVAKLRNIGKLTFNVQANFKP
jgi:hypothetical protein